MSESDSTKKSTLNVPKLNAGASEFVPSWAAKPAAASTAKVGRIFHFWFWFQLFVILPLLFSFISLPHRPLLSFPKVPRGITTITPVARDRTIITIETIHAPIWAAMPQ